MLKLARLPAVLLLLVLTGCPPQEPAKVTLSVTLEGTGSVTSNPAGLDCGATCAAAFAPQTSVTLTAVPAAGQVFTGWGGACAGTTPTCTVTLEADASVVARFAVERRTVTVTVGGNGTGTVASTPAGIACPGMCSSAVAKGASVTLTATPGTGSSFVGWTGGGCSGTAPCVVAATNDVTVQATFAVLQFAVSVTLAGTGGGTVTSAPAGLDCGTSCSALFDLGTMVTLTPTPDTSSTFTGWSGACTGTGACTVAVSQATAVTATFALRQFDLTVTRAGNGTGQVTSVPAGISCGSDCSETLTIGTQVTLTATPATGSTFTGWTGACSGTATCVVSLTAAQNVTATFTLEQHALTVALAGTGTGAVASAPAGISCGATCASPFDYGTVVTLTATAATGSTFAGWSGACSGTATCQVSVAAAASVTATFTANLYTLTVNKTGVGTGSVSSAPAGITCGATCAATFTHGTSITLTATADAGSAFSGWSGACTGRGPCTVSLTAATSVTATFMGRGRFFSVRDSDRVLQRFEWATPGAPVTVGPIGSPYAFGDLAWNSGNGTLYLVDGRNTNSLYTVNTTTGASTLVGVHGQVDMFALAYHPPTDALYGISGDRLYRLNTTTGAATLIGTAALAIPGSVDGLAWDSTRERLVAFTSGALSVYAINVTTGASTHLAGPLASLANHGVTYDGSADKFVVSDYNGDIQELDPMTFSRASQATSQGSHTNLAWVP